ncbi:MAG: alpha/beta fold hydrolase [Alphaproteobacteria bacterium]
MTDRARPASADRFLEVDNVRLRYRDAGAGDAIVLIHGNGGMIEDFTVGGLWDLAAATGRTIAFDRPGSGHSTRPRGRRWTPAAQAGLLLAALRRLEVRNPVVVGHSWGALVAVEMGLRAPETIRGLVLACGYLFPTRRFDVAFGAAMATPRIGSVMRRTVLPVVLRLSRKGFVRRLFAPDPVPARFAHFPIEVVLGRSQLRAMAEDTAYLNPACAALQPRYADVRVPVAIVAGADDRIVDTRTHSARLARQLPHAALRIVPGGHMVHYSAPDAIVEACRRIRQTTLSRS